ncbi:MAG: hypothetical protein PHF24_02775 [Syntrophomonas sp.]|nr:hypothetical protein [Syntrophomonas sp.]
MYERDLLLAKKTDLEQMIKNNQDNSVMTTYPNDMSDYASHPADVASHLQSLNIELERINDMLAAYHPEQLS